MPLDAQRPGVASSAKEIRSGTFASAGARSARPRVISELVPDSGANARLTTRKEYGPMGAKTEQVKGQVKEAAGTLTGDKDLESEGKADRRAGEAKEKLDDVKEKVDDIVEKTSSKLDEVIDKTKGALHQK